MNYLDISQQLEKHHSIFYMFWKMGKPIFTNKVDTAAVAFDRDGEFIQFLFNREYWNSLSEYERLFTIAHECLHVILDHGVRTKDAKANSLACNVALDVVVNHTLVDRFGFDRKSLRDDNKLCWMDTVYPNQEVKSNQSFEYYYNLLPKIDVPLFSGFSGDGEGFAIPDEHERLSQSDFDGFLDEVASNLSDEEKGAIKELTDQLGEDQESSKTAGSTAGGRWAIANVGVVQRKRKWETVIKKWSKKYDRPEFHDIEQWARLNRRFSFLDGGLLLPSEMEQEFELEGKIDVWFFQDTSVSCASFRDRFFKAAMTLNPDRFNVHMHCFDTQVYKTTLESKKLFGFGGTSFQPIENYIQAEMKSEKKTYPEAVFVITDGYGSSVKPEKAKNWYWFLSTNYKHYIPKDSNIFNLKDYE